MFQILKSFLIIKVQFCCEGKINCCNLLSRESKGLFFCCEGNAVNSFIMLAKFERILL